MPYLANSIRLEKLIDTLPQEVRQIFGEIDPVTIAQNIGAKYELTFDEIDTLYGIIADAFEKKPTTNLTERIEAGLDEDNKSRAAEVASALAENFFAKLEIAQPESKPTGIPPTPYPAAFVRMPSSLSSPTEPSIRKVEPFRESKVQPLMPPTAPALDEKHLRALFRISVGTDYTEDALREKFETLPHGLKQAIASVDTANTVQGIAKKFLLHVDQMGALTSETGLVLLGFTHPRDFTKNLAKRLRVSEQRALEIAKEISTEIFVKVKEALRGLHEEKDTNIRMGTNDTNKKEKTLNVLAAQTEQGASLNTPYSRGTRWGIEETSPSREEVLRGLENPPRYQTGTRYDMQREAVGPTGWRPTKDTNMPVSTNLRIDTNKIEEEKHEIPEPPTPPKPQPIIPASEKPKDFLDKKLTESVQLPGEERRYTIDPYREPLG